MLKERASSVMKGRSVGLNDGIANDFRFATDPRGGCAQCRRS